MDIAVPFLNLNVSNIFGGEKSLTITTIWGVTSALVVETFAKNHALKSIVYQRLCLQSQDFQA